MLSGVLLILSFPKFGHGAVAWVALAPAARGPARAPRGREGAAARLPHGRRVRPRAALLDGAGGRAVRRASACPWASWSWCCSASRSRSSPRSSPGGVPLAARLRPGAPAARAFAWVATEILRAHTFFQFPWCLLGYSQHANLPSSRSPRAPPSTASRSLVVLVVGAPGLRAWSRGPGAARARRWSASRRRRRRPARLRGAGVLAQPAPNRAGSASAWCRAASARSRSGSPSSAWANVERHLDLTGRRPRGRAARGLARVRRAVLYDDNPALAAALREAARRRRRSTCVFGNDDRERTADGADRVFVGAKMSTPAGDLLLRYHKIRLVPFGEYVPLQPLLTLGGRVAAKLVEQVADFTPGSEAVVGEVGRPPRRACFICYEAIFPDLVRRFTRGRGRAAREHHERRLVRHDLGALPAPRHGRLPRGGERPVPGARRQHRHHRRRGSARPRARARPRCSSRTVLVRDVPFVAGRTFYARHGDVFAWGCLAAARRSRRLARERARAPAPRARSMRP